MGALEHFRPLSLGELNRAWTKVWREIDGTGFGCRRLATCQVWLGVVSLAYGYQWFGDRPAGRACGDIVLPRVSFAQWVGYLRGIGKVSALDVLRHEYGHAYADVNRRRIETRRFERAFGLPHGWDVDCEYDPECHVTEYAATASAEDFAEVFWLFLKHKGQLPRRFDTPVRKWRFVDELRRVV